MGYPQKGHGTSGSIIVEDGVPPKRTGTGQEGKMIIRVFLAFGFQPL